MKLRSLIPLNVLREADDEKDTEANAGGDDAEATESPFAAADDAGTDGEETDAAADSEEGDQEPGTKPIEIGINTNRVRKYNKTKFTGDKGIVTGVSKHGITIMMPNQATIFVNFDDIL